MNKPLHLTGRAWFGSFSPMQLFLLAAVAGVLAAAQLFYLARRDADLLVWLLLVFLSGITCFAGYMFTGVGIGLGVNVCFGLLIGICTYAIFPSRRPKDRSEHKKAW